MPFSCIYSRLTSLMERVSSEAAEERAQLDRELLGWAGAGRWAGWWVAGSRARPRSGHTSDSRM